MKLELIFDDNNQNHTSFREYNEVFVRTQSHYFNDRIRVHEFVTLNDVLENLGYEKTSSGMTQGWIKHEPIEISYNFDSETITIGGFSEIQHKVS